MPDSPSLYRRQRDLIAKLADALRTRRLSADERALIDAADELLRSLPRGRPCKLPAIAELREVVAREGVAATAKRFGVRESAVYNALHR